VRTVKGKKGKIRKKKKKERREEKKEKKERRERRRERGKEGGPWPAVVGGGLGSQAICEGVSVVQMEKIRVLEMVFRRTKL